jgi:BirA family biotin operon repressor/biotin-[acetyl-CoA-carboxylase] ligase
VLHEYAVVGSTNLVAANLPVWEAVRADTQTAGRGRFQRSWVSDQGGLWLSAVVPAQTPTASVLPLVAGLAVCQTLQTLGVQRLRLRWPNDVLIDDLKLAGLLIDQFSPGAAVAGIGVNVSNQPEVCDAGLKNHTTRLADLLATPPSLRALAGLLLGQLRRAVSDLQDHGFAALLPRINALWSGARRVELDLDGVLRAGLFSGIDEEGRLILSEETGSRSAYAAHQVRHLQEI